jgi:hypothetical protein
MSTGPALLLLLLVTAGLFTMHTLGHSGPHDSAMHAHAMAPAPPPVPSNMAAKHSDGQAQASDQGPEKPLPFGSLAVCMAVLGTLVVLVIAALLSKGIACWTARLTPLTRRVMDMVRGPPGVPIGLLVADLSVARN